MELEKLLISVLLVMIIIFLLKKAPSKKLPPGSMGWPILGHNLSFLKALRANKEEAWLRDRIRKYGPIFKLNLFGSPTVFISGQAANKFVYTCSADKLSNQLPPWLHRISGERNVVEMRGEEHKKIRAAVVSFLKPEELKYYVARIDEKVREHLDMHWHGRNEIKVMPLMKAITFNIICSLIFGIEQGQRRDTIEDHFQYMTEGMLSIPINLPFTRFNRSLRANAKIKSLIKDIVREKKEALDSDNACPHQDLITCLLSVKRDDNSDNLSDEEIVDTVTMLLIAGYDTSSVLLAFLVRLFATKPSIYSNVVQEQERISQSKGLEELLTWDDLVKMKYTWRVALETLRVTPPVAASFRRALQDIEYEGYTIPKEWQVMWFTSMTHMDDDIFKDPLKFDVVRFERQPPPYSFIAFGGGPRVFPGSEFSKIVTLVMVHYMVRRFTWKLSCDDDSYYRNPLPIFNQDLPIQIISEKYNSAF